MKRFVLEGELHEGVSSMKTKFLADVIAVGFNSAAASTKFVSYVFARLVFGNQFKYA